LVAAIGVGVHRAGPEQIEAEGGVVRLPFDGIASAAVVDALVARVRAVHVAPPLSISVKGPSR
jgi:hypothetical protein